MVQLALTLDMGCSAITVEITEALIKDRRRELTEVDVNTDDAEDTEYTEYIDILQEEHTAESDDDGSLDTGPRNRIYSNLLTISKILRGPCPVVLVVLCQRAREI